MSIRYFETFETYGDDWEMIDVGEGYQSVVFDMPDTDIVDMLQRVEIHAPENGYRPDMNGKTWMQNESNAVDIERCKDNEGMTARRFLRHMELLKSRITVFYGWWLCRIQPRQNDI